MNSLIERLQNSTDKEICKLIFENAICSMIHALDHYTESNPNNTNYKYTIIHLAHSLELVFKAKLSIENRYFILKNLDNVKTGTVNTAEAYERLKKLVLIDFSAIEEVQINSIRMIRNEIEHFVFEGNKDRFDKVISFIVSYWCSFTKRNIPVDLEKCFSRKHYRLILNIDKTHKKLLDACIEKLNKKISELNKEDNKVSFRAYCENCFEKTVLLNLYDYTAKCYYCGELSDVGTCDSCGTLDIIKSGHDEFGLCGNCSDYPEDDWKNWVDR